jgi:hypothetical protein
MKSFWSTFVDDKRSELLSRKFCSRLTSRNTSPAKSAIRTRHSGGFQTVLVRVDFLEIGARLLIESRHRTVRS